ncbi:MAG TPA: Wzt carbohydrate-binding domain-containing protein, partial [Phycisphaerales bacterium]|nr:Wzt carbohydrate-binding domain-containing protein [Phycisphaerales bacterium]
GSGKSTVLQLVAGVLAPTTGEVTIRGKVNALLELGAGFNPEFTGRENVQMSAAIQGFQPSEMESIIQHIADFADIGQFFDQPMKTYSSGMYVRVAFGAAVVLRPDILVVDEALAVGDIFFQQKCMRYMRDELQGVTKLIVTHDMGSIASLCDRCLVMHRGVLHFDGDPAEAIEFYTKLVHNEEYRRESRVAVPALPASPAAASTQTLASAIERGQVGRLASQVNPDAWVDVEPDSLGGAGDVVIERIAVTDRRGARLATAKPGDRYIAWLIVRAELPKKNLIFGAALVDRTGTVVCGDNSFSTPGVPVDFDRPGRSVIRMEFEWPRLQPATYTVTFGCGEGEHPLQHVIQCWAHNVVAIAGISPDLPIHGVFTNPLRAFDAERLEAVAS